MKKYTTSLVAFCFLLIANTAYGTLITTSVSGRSGPWVSSLNPAFNYGSSVQTPTVVDGSTGLALAPGDVVTVTYLSGLTNGGGGGIYSDAN
ncbi:MAG TPA: hypothetical protein VKA76_04380, partial [Gammaproteobacteria bacterium]|nr:hypothetical protein [Gammaproteobacteria bacterium]